MWVGEGVAGKVDSNHRKAATASGDHSSGRQLSLGGSGTNKLGNEDGRRVQLSDVYKKQSHLQMLAKFTPGVI